jgi:hypothetical protein
VLLKHLTIAHIYVYLCDRIHDMVFCHPVYTQKVSASVNQKPEKFTDTGWNFRDYVCSVHIFLCSAGDRGDGRHSVLGIRFQLPQQLMDLCIKLRSPTCQPRGALVKCRASQLEEQGTL